MDATRKCTGARLFQTAQWSHRQWSHYQGRRPTDIRTLLMTNILSRNVGLQSCSDRAPYPRRTETSIGWFFVLRWASQAGSSSSYQLLAQWGSFLRNTHTHTHTHTHTQNTHTHTHKHTHFLSIHLPSHPFCTSSPSVLLRLADFLCHHLLMTRTPPSFPRVDRRV